MTKSEVTWQKPSHPGLIAVKVGSEAFSTRAVSLQSLPANAVFAKIKTETSVSQRTYATVQSSKTSDIELNSDLVYCNHSCDPSVVFDMHKMEVRVVSHKSLNKGDDVTFFYPSTEWNMSQPFVCTCGAKGCIGVVRGACHIDNAILKKYWLNNHIIELLEERDQKTKSL